MKLKIKYVSPHIKKPPKYASEGAAGIDLVASIDEPITLKPFDRILVPTGIAAEIPRGYAGLVYARSGLAAKYGITLSNCVGVVDSDYRGEIKCSIINLGNEEFTINPGDRIAQMVLTPAPVAEIEIVDELDETKRGQGGFGSTGLK